MIIKNVIILRLETSIVLLEKGGPSSFITIVIQLFRDVLDVGPFTICSPYTYGGNIKAFLKVVFGLHS